MHLSLTGTAIAIGLLCICTVGMAQERPVSSGQGFVVHVPQKVNFGLRRSSVKKPDSQQKNKDVESLMFDAVANSGMTIQFETDSQRPLKLTVSDGNWSTGKTSDLSGSTSEFEARASSVQATTFSPGPTTLQLDVSKPEPGSDAGVTTIVVTFIAH